MDPALLDPPPLPLMREPTCVPACPRAVRPAAAAAPPPPPAPAAGDAGPLLSPWAVPRGGSCSNVALPCAPCTTCMLGPCVRHTGFAWGAAAASLSLPPHAAPALAGGGGGEDEFPAAAAPPVWGGHPPVLRTSPPSPPVPSPRDGGPPTSLAPPPLGGLGTRPRALAVSGGRAHSCTAGRARHAARSSEMYWECDRLGVDLPCGGGHSWLCPSRDGPGASPRRPPPEADTVPVIWPRSAACRRQMVGPDALCTGPCAAVPLCTPPLFWPQAGGAAPAAR